MKKSKFTESQIVFALHQAETGTKVAEVCRKMSISEETFYNWKKKFGGLGTSELRRLHVLEEENPQLKKLVADLSLGQYRVSERRVARVTMLTRPTFRYRPVERCDEPLRARICEIALAGCATGSGVSTCCCVARAGSQSQACIPDL